MNVNRAESITPRRAALLVFACALIFITVRVLIPAHHNPARLIVAGSDFAAAPGPSIPTYPGSGYDGQFYWRLAVDPTALDPAAAYGLRLDQPLRATRLGYPVIAWVLSLGSERLTPIALILANLAAISVLTWAAASLCRDHHRPIWLALVIAGVPGVITALSRDLTEVTLCTAVVLGTLFISRRQPVIGALCLALAASIHEQSLVVVLAYAAWSLYTRHHRHWREHLVWFLPLTVAAAMQVIVWRATGTLAIANSRSQSIDIPFFGLAQSIKYWFTGGLLKQEVILPLQFAHAVCAVALGIRARLPEELGWLRVALICQVAVACFLSFNVWKAPIDMRQVVLVPVLGLLCVACGSPTTVSRVSTGVLCAGTCATMLLRVLAI